MTAVSEVLQKIRVIEGVMIVGGEGSIQEEGWW